ncbi:hypothetical protein [Pseudomonas savastanoi]|uniref:hypothetical protein n=1 Tax=Pseudomonas savastanoi TaxID=29438 RepID=UPI000EFEAF6B|nr:hypothetical protein [Pseudomonas savastanoi]
MVRTHTLVEYRLKEYELEQALRSLKAQQEGLDYKLDVEFYLRLEALAKDFGYSFRQVYDLLYARHSGETSGADVHADELKAKTNTGLLEMIQRLEQSPRSAPPGSVNPPQNSQSHSAQRLKEPLVSTLGQPHQGEPELVSNAEGGEHEHRIEEKVND